MEISPEYSASIYRDEVTSRKLSCCYDQQGCTARAEWVYSIGAGLGHPGCHVQLCACSVHDVQVSKHAENIVKMIMAETKARNS